MQPTAIDKNLSKESAIQLPPFLKWAGGKRWLSTSYPQIFPTQFDRYVEPFLGSGAVFFGLQPKRAVLSDMNSELILTYRAIRDDWRAVQTALDRHRQKHSAKHYYEERDRVRRTPHEKAARFLYLNRTCWNGLYRVNLRGKFNVPKGTKDNVFLPTDDFHAISNLLANVKLITNDFEKIIENTKNGDFLLIDPPYTVKPNLNAFIKYNEQLFTWDDQVRLASVVFRAATRGIKILITNADHEEIRNLYHDTGFFKTLYRYSVLAGEKLSRGRTTELGIMINYEPEEESHARLS